MLGNKVSMFRTWQASMQLCLEMGFIWLELGRNPHSNAAIISLIRLQFGSLICSHVAGIRLELGRLLCGCAVGISLICIKLGSLLCSGAGIRLVPLCFIPIRFSMTQSELKPLFWPGPGIGLVPLHRHSNPHFSGPIRVRTTFLSKNWKKFDLFRT